MTHSLLPEYDSILLFVFLRLDRLERLAGEVELLDGMLVVVGPRVVPPQPGPRARLEQRVAERHGGGLRGLERDLRVDRVESRQRRFPRQQIRVDFERRIADGTT